MQVEMRVFDPETDTELDFFIFTLQELQRMEQAAREHAAQHPGIPNYAEQKRDVFHRELVSYFRLQPHMDNWGVFLELLRLNAIPAGQLGSQV